MDPRERQHLAAAFERRDAYYLNRLPERPKGLWRRRLLAIGALVVLLIVTLMLVTGAFDPLSGLGIDALTGGR